MEQAGKDGAANLVLNRVNLAAEMPPPLRMLWDAQEHPSSPWLVLMYPRQSGIEKPAWAGPLSQATAGTLLESPVRREIARRLLSGDAVVWLLLESGDKRRDAEAAEIVEVETRKLEQTLALPKPSPLDPPINANLPLKIAFSTVRVARSDPAEGMLVNLLLNCSTNLGRAAEAMLFPVFGRGRAISPAIGNEIRPEAIREMAEFLTGPCSCQVKEMNPGFDLLLSANWSSLSGYQEVSLPEPPPLISMSQFAAAAVSNVTATSTPAAVRLVAGSPSLAVVEPDHLTRNLLVVLGICGLFLAAMTVVLKVRARRGSR